MDLSIGIDFAQLDECIASMRLLLEELDEPNYKKVEFWMGNNSGGSGSVHDALYSMCNRTIDFHASVYLLIQNTIGYLEMVKKLQEADLKIASSL